jgi:hypothetical protein
MKTRLVLTLTSSALLAGGCKEAADRPPSPPSSGTARPQTAQAALLTAMSKGEVKRLLATIERAQAPEPKMGAMCYRMALPPDRMEYVCPTCGEKTLYEKEVSWTWMHQLDACRRLFKELPKHDTMTLDESSFCRKCRPGTNAPSLRLVIRYDDRTSNVVSGITSQDLRLLKGLLSGDRSYRTSNEGQVPLKQELPRLRALLGIKDE